MEQTFYQQNYQAQQRDDYILLLFDKHVPRSQWYQGTKQVKKEYLVAYRELIG